VEESHKLPEKLHEWLFPPDGGTRDLQTLQVTFGSGEDFFASDKEGKISNRDPVPEILAAAVEMDPSAQKDVLVASASDGQLKRLDSKPVLKKLERRRTDLFTKMELKTSTKPESPVVLRRRSTLGSRMLPVINTLERGTIDNIDSSLVHSTSTPTSRSPVNQRRRSILGSNIIPLSNATNVETHGDGRMSVLGQARAELSTRQSWIEKKALPRLQTQGLEEEPAKPLMVQHEMEQTGLVKIEIRKYIDSSMQTESMVNDSSDWKCCCNTGHRSVHDISVGGGFQYFEEEEYFLGDGLVYL